MRKLVTIRKIDKILPIKNKDRIMQAIVDGWSVIVKKDEFKEGDLCIFFEIDSFLPIEERYSFLEKTRKTYKGKDGYRLKTMKMSGVISQGLALPLHTFKDKLVSIEEKEGTDVTEQLKVIKYDVAEVSSTQGGLKPGNTQGKFPSFIPKTDQERIQNLTHYFESMKDLRFEETLKLDGSSMTCYKTSTSLNKVQKYINLVLEPLTSWFNTTVFKPKVHFGVCSRNLELKRSSKDSISNFWAAAIKYEIEDKLPVGYAIQGELIGPSIQSNHEKVEDLEYYVFDVYDINKGVYLLPDERRKFCETYNIPHVPVANKNIQIFKEHKNIESLLKSVEGQSMNPGTISEGRVYKCITNPSLTFKAISNKYLLKCED